jgi:hypothetical protein
MTPTTHHLTTRQDCRSLLSSLFEEVSALESSRRLINRLVPDIMAMLGYTALPGCPAHQARYTVSIS